MNDIGCTHLDTIRNVKPKTNGCEECSEDRLNVGAPARVPQVRHRRLLRLVAAQARDRALPWDETPDRSLAGPGEDWKFCYVDNVMWECDPGALE